jgi:hypothetical protein
VCAKHQPAERRPRLSTSVIPQSVLGGFPDRRTAGRTELMHLHEKPSVIRRKISFRRTALQNTDIGHAELIDGTTGAASEVVLSSFCSIGV